MKLSNQIKPISYLKAHASRLVRDIGKKGDHLVITQSGQARAVLQDVRAFEQMQQTMALLKILALGNRQIEQGRVKPARQVLDRLRAKHRALSA